MVPGNTPQILSNLVLLHLALNARRNYTLFIPLDNTFHLMDRVSPIHRVGITLSPRRRPRIAFCSLDL